MGAVLPELSRMALRLSDLHDGDLVGPVNEVPPGKGDVSCRAE